MGDSNQNAERESLGIFTNIWWCLSVAGTIIALFFYTIFLLIVSVIERLWQVQNVRRVDKEKFWINVGKCLVEFHGYTPERAVDTVNKHKREPRAKMPAFYYKQPFKLANELTGHEVELPLEEYKERYLKKILEQ